MPTVFINNIAVILPSRFALGQALTENAALVLNDVQLKRIKARLRYMLAHGDVNTDGLQDTALALLDTDLVPYATIDDDDENLDPVLEEALSIARELIIGRMAAEGLPPPKGLDVHAKALVDGQPKIQEQARRRIEARYKAAQDILEGAV
jgi:hypothetical protein